MSKKISELPLVTSPLIGDELIEVVQSGVNKKATASLLTASAGENGMGLWTWVSSTSGDPGVGCIGSDSASAASVTSLRISEISLGGSDYSALLDLVKVGDVITIQVPSGGLAHRYSVTGIPTENVSYRSIPVIHELGTGTLPAVGQMTSLKVTLSSSSSPATSLTAIPVACSDEVSALTSGVAKVTFRMPFSLNLSEVRASLSTAQSSGAILTVDINAAGASILSTKLTIDNGEKTSTTAATQAVISSIALADDSEVTIDLDEIGDGTAKGLKVYLIGTLG